MRMLGTALGLLLALEAGRAQAQVVEPWAPRVGPWVPAGSPEIDPRAQVLPIDQARRVAASRTRRDAIVVAGVALLSVAYASAIAWGVHYRSSLRLGAPMCNDPYADWHFVPLIGPAVGLGLGWSCIPDFIHGDELLVSTFTSAVQIVGLGLLLGGVFRQIPDPPPIAVIVDEHTAFARVGGRF